MPPLITIHTRGQRSMARPRPKRRGATMDEARARKVARARALTNLAEGRLTLSDALSHAEDLATADLWDVLLRAPGVGQARARQACERSGIWPHTKVGELDEFEREVLLKALGKGEAPPQ